MYHGILGYLGTLFLGPGLLGPFEPDPYSKEDTMQVTVRPKLCMYDFSKEMMGSLQ